MAGEVGGGGFAAGGFLEEEEAKSQETEQIFRGRKVKVRQRALSETDKKQRRKAIAETILQAMRRMKPKD